jgi:hypothetical protein
MNKELKDRCVAALLVQLENDGGYIDARELDCTCIDGYYDLGDLVEAVIVEYLK